MGEECNECSAPGTAVRLNLVRYHLTHPWQRDLEAKEFSFCESPGCPVVYFSVDGAVFKTEDVRKAPAYKTGKGADPLCFCFNVTGDDIVDSDPSPYVRERVRRGDCACDVLNPSGECCLGSIGRWQQQHPRLLTPI
jgi:hypothetical protein